MTTRAAVVVAILCTFIGVGSARGSAALGDLSSVAHVVEVNIVGSDLAIRRMGASVLELFARRDVRVEVYEHGPESPLGEGELRGPGASGRTEGMLLAIVYIDLSDEGNPRVVVLEGDSGVQLVRREFSASSLETAVETSAHVTYLAVQTLLDEADLQKAEALPPAPAPLQRPPADAAPRAPTRSEVGSLFFAEIGASGQLLSRGHSFTVPGAGLLSFLGMHTDRHSLSLFAALGAHAAGSMQSEALSAQLRPVTVRLSLAYEVVLDPTVSFLVGAGGGLDWFRLRRATLPEGVEGTSVGSVVQPLVMALAGARLPLGGRVAFLALGAAEITPAPHRFVSRVGGVEQTLRAMPHVGATFMIAASVALAERRYEGQPGAP